MKNTSIILKLALTSLFSFCFLLSGLSQENHPPTSGVATIIEEEDVPKEILSELNERIANQDFEVLEWRTHDQNYEVKLKGNKHYTFMVFDSKNRFIEKKVRLNWEKEAPSAIKDALSDSKFKEWEVLRFYEIFPKEKESYYRAQLKSKNNELANIQISNKGKLTVIPDNKVQN